MTRISRFVIRAPRSKNSVHVFSNRNALAGSSSRWGEQGGDCHGMFGDFPGVETSLHKYS